MSACMLVQTTIFVLSSVNLGFFPISTQIQARQRPVPWAMPRKIRILDTESNRFLSSREELDISFQSYAGGSGEENYNERMSPVFLPAWTKLVSCSLQVQEPIALVPGSLAKGIAHVLLIKFVLGGEEVPALPILPSCLCHPW